MDKGGGNDRKRDRGFDIFKITVLIDKIRRFYLSVILFGFRHKKCTVYFYEYE